MAIAVIDIGNTNAKVALVDLMRLAETDVRKTPNDVVFDGPYPHYDIDHLWQFILESLAALSAEAQVDAVSVTTHGATAALLDAEGRLAARQGRKFGPGLARGVQPGQAVMPVPDPDVPQDRAGQQGHQGEHRQARLTPAGDHHGGGQRPQGLSGVAAHLEHGLRQAVAPARGHARHARGFRVEDR